MVNPVQSSNDQSLTDDKDAASAVPASAYATVPLRNLDGSGYLRGKWVYVESSTGTPAYSRTGEYFFTRNQDQFEQVMAYFWVDRAQTYLQSLGFGYSPRHHQGALLASRSTSTAATTATRPTSRTGSGSARAASTTPRTPR